MALHIDGQIIEAFTDRFEVAEVVMGLQQLADARKFFRISENHLNLVQDLLFGSGGPTEWFGHPGKLERLLRVVHP